MRQLKRPDNPKYSVVIPAFNEELLIGACLESLANQNTSISFEVIVVDNNSTDRTDEIAKHHGARVIKESNAGVCWARQAGLSASKGEIIVSTDADTTFPINWLENINNQMVKQGVVAVGGTVTFTGNIWWVNAWAKALFGFSEVWRKIFKQPFYISACNLTFRKSAINNYETNLTQGGDELDILRQLKRHGNVTLDFNNTVYTSDRRATRGFFYSFFVTFLWYYLLGYNLSRITKRTVFGGYPAFRGIRKHTQTPFFQKFLPRVSMVLFFAFIFTHTHPAKAARLIESFPKYLNSHIHTK